MDTVGSKPFAKVISKGQRISHNDKRNISIYKKLQAILNPLYTNGFFLLVYMIQETWNDQLYTSRGAGYDFQKIM